MRLQASVFRRTTRIEDRYTLDNGLVFDIQHVALDFELPVSTHPDQANIRRALAIAPGNLQEQAGDFAAGDRSSGFIFVVGMPRSGTTLTEQILASHPDIRGAEGASLSVETTPADFLRLGKIALLFPAARIVHCVRDPLDTCLSIYEHPLSATHAYAHDLATLGRYYLKYMRLMAHWQRIVPNQVLELRYEALVTDLESTVRDLLNYCGVAFDDRCLRFYETIGRSVRRVQAR